MSIKKSICIFIFFLLVNSCVLYCIDSIKSSADYSFEQNSHDKETVVQASKPLAEPAVPMIELKKDVRLYFEERDVVETIDIEEYLAGVLAAEMYFDAPFESLKAMAIAARTYTLYMCSKNIGKDYDVVADHNYSQAYISKEKAIEAWNESGELKYEIMCDAVNATAGEVICYNKELICALYHASSYPSTESCENVFIEKLPYLIGKPSVETKENTYNSQAVFNLDEFNTVLHAHGLPVLSKVPQILSFKNENERCEYLQIKDDRVSFTISGKDIRSVFGLRSTSFDVRFNIDNIVFDVYGFGHGVGLSQNGAVILANKGKCYTEILLEYYPGTEIYKTIYIE